MFDVCGFMPLGAAVPAAVDAIASGLMPDDGETGYVVVGPTPAKASAEGSPLKPNMLNFGIDDRQPVIDAMATMTQTPVRNLNALDVMKYPGDCNDGAVIGWRLVNASEGSSGSRIRACPRNRERAK